MISARLIKALENKGFSLDFPGYNSPEVIILEILQENNPRLNLSITLFLTDKINYGKIIENIDNIRKREFNKIILISEKIYKNGGIDSKIHELIKENKIKAQFSKQEFENYYRSFKENQIKSAEKTQKIIEKQSKLRLNLDLNKSLTTLFSPAKIRIMSKIFNHEKLTNTELKYYYRSISNINKAILNQSIQDYARIIEISKKFADKV